MDSSSLTALANIYTDWLEEKILVKWSTNLNTDKGMLMTHFVSGPLEWMFRPFLRHFAQEGNLQFTHGNWKP